MWRCGNCGYQIKHSKNIFVKNGYCPKCKKYHVLERFDPLNNNGK